MLCNFVLILCNLLEERSCAPMVSDLARGGCGV